MKKKIQKVKKSVEKKVKHDTKIESYNPMKAKGKMDYFDFKFITKKIKEKLYPEKIVLINMELTNGMHKLFMVLENDSGFTWKDKKFLFDVEAKYFCIDAGLWCFDYHEEFSIPIKRQIPVNTIKKVLEASNISEVEYAANPLTLERFAISKIAEGVMKGQQIDEFLKQMKLLIIITMVATIIHLLLFMFKTGMLSNIKIPGIN